MRKKYGVAQSGFNVKPFDWVAYNKEKEKKRRDYLERERLRTQLAFPFNVARTNEICPECGCRRGVKCKNCNSTGFVQVEPKKISPPCMLEEQPSVPTPTEECRRCWGVGQIANTKFVVKLCPDCEGTGRVESKSEQRRGNLEN